MSNKTPKKLTGAQLREVIKKIIKESNLANDVLPGAAPELVEYTTKVEKFIEDTIEEAEKLHAEGEKLTAANVLNNNLVAERNRLILMVMGFLKRVKNGLSTSSIELRRMF